MDSELEVIRDEMEHTRANLADKLGALESQVRETVSSASETVTSTVEGVKEVVGTVSETVGTVTDTLNISKQIEKHPWVALGVAVAAGYVASQMFGGTARGAPQGPQPDYRPRRDEPAPGAPQPESYRAASPAPEPVEKEKGPSLMEQAASMLPSLSSFVPDIAGKAAAALPAFGTLAPEIEKLGNTVASGLGGLAVGGVMNIIRELAVEALPDSWKGEICKLVDDVTEQLGGKPLCKQEQQDEQKDSASQKSDEQGQGGQNVQNKPNQQTQGGQRGRREGRNQLVGQG